MPPHQLRSWQPETIAGGASPRVLRSHPRALWQLTVSMWRRRGVHVHIEGWFGAVWKLEARRAGSVFWERSPLSTAIRLRRSSGSSDLRTEREPGSACVCVQVIGYRRPHTTPLMKGYHSNGVTVKRTIPSQRRNFNGSWVIGSPELLDCLLMGEDDEVFFLQLIGNFPAFRLHKDGTLSCCCYHVVLIGGSDARTGKWWQTIEG